MENVIHSSQKVLSLLCWLHNLLSRLVSCWFPVACSQDLWQPCSALAQQMCLPSCETRGLLPLPNFDLKPSFTTLMWPENIWSLHIFVNVCYSHCEDTWLYHLPHHDMGVACWPPGRLYILHVRKNELLIKQNISDGQATLSVKERASETAVLAGGYGYVSVWCTVLLIETLLAILQSFIQCLSLFSGSPDSQWAVQAGMSWL